MKIAVIVFPGSNCDIDLYEAAQFVMLMWNMFRIEKRV